MEQPSESELKVLRIGLNVAGGRSRARQRVAALAIAGFLSVSRAGEPNSSFAVEDIRAQSLPVLVIDSYGQGITQRQELSCELTVLAGVDPVDRLAGVVPYTQIDYHGRAGIHVRGNSSSVHEKLPYKLELQDGAGRDLKAPLLGMPAESDWVLNACYSDKSLIRDALAMELWRAMGHYAPRTRFVEVFIVGAGRRTTNSSASVGSASGVALTTFEVDALAGQVGCAAEDYAGIYLLMEKIKRGKDRVAIRKSSPDGDSNSWFRGGYIFKKDRVNPGERGFVSSRVGLHFVYEDPKERDLLPEQQEWLHAHVANLEHALFREEFDNPILGYPAYLDVESFIDFHWLVEVGKNIDGYWFSQYFHFDRHGKVKIGPVWDWDLSFGNCFYHDGFRPDGWRWEKIRGPHYKWYARLFDDPDFLQRYIDRWHELRSALFATSNLLARVDALVANVIEAQVRNYRRWKTLGIYVHPNRFIGKTYDEEVAWLKDWVRQRLAWIDSQGFPPPEAGTVVAATTIPGATGSPATLLTLSSQSGRIFYTRDGSDPRRPGGWPASTAREYTAPIAIGTNETLCARVRSDEQLWSAPTVVWRGSNPGEWWSRNYGAGIGSTK